MRNQHKNVKPGAKRRVVTLSNYNKGRGKRLLTQRMDGLRSEEMNYGTGDRLAEVESTNTDQSNGQHFR